MNDELVLAGTSTRAQSVLSRIVAIKDDLMARSLEMGRLLREVRDNAYYLEYGHSQFGEWVDNSGLDMGRRSAYYAISVIEFAEKHGIDDDQLKRIGISKAKELAALPADLDEQTVLDLATEAESLSYNDLKDVCGVLKNTDYVYKTLKLTRDFADNQWVEALERARRRYGNTQGGEDITDERCLEVIFADFCAQPDFEEDGLSDYAVLTRQVHERDGWKCRVCRSREALHAHHLMYRSQGGQDTMENLITLCNRCHTLLHGSQIELLPVLPGPNSFGASFNANATVVLRDLRCDPNSNPNSKYQDNLRTI